MIPEKNFQREDDSRENIYTRTMRVKLPEMFPGIDRPMSFADKPEDRRPLTPDKFSNTEIDISMGKDKEGIAHYKLRVSEPFDYRRIQDLKFGLSRGNKRKAHFVPDEKVDKSKFDEFVAETNKMGPAAVTDVLEAAVSKFRTISAAEREFLEGRYLAVGYEKIMESIDLDSDISGFISDIAEVIKNDSSLWSGRDPFAISDSEAIERFGKAVPAKRKSILEGYYNSLNDDEKKEAIKRHMSVFGKAMPFEVGSRLLGFYEGEIYRIGSGSWITNEGIVKIDAKANGFSLEAQSPSAVIAEIAWKTEKGNSENRHTTESPKAKREKLEKQKGQFMLVHNIPPENHSELLALMFLDHINNVWNKIERGVSEGVVMQDCFMRKNVILNNEFVRRIEKRMSA